MGEFLKSPDACSPTFSGYDPMLFLKEGKLVNGDVQHGLLDKDNHSFMFFSSAEMKQEFERDFANNVRAINFIIQQAYGTN